MHDPAEIDSLRLQTRHTCSTMYSPQTSGDFSVVIVLSAAATERP